MTTVGQNVSIFYDKPLHTGRYIEGGAIKPDIVIWDKQDRTAQIIEVTVPGDFRINSAEREKMNKYQDLKHDLKTTWNVREVEIIPVVVSATGIMKKNLPTYLLSIPGNPSPEEIQLCAVKGTVTILKRALGFSAG